MSEEGQPSEPIREPEPTPFMPQPPSKEVQEVISLRNLLESKKGEGKIGIMEWLMVSDYMDRREDRKLQRSQPQQQPLTKEDIIKITKEVVTPPTAEPSAEMQELLRKITDIEGKMEKQDKEKENQQLIKEATEPFKTELEKERERSTKLEEAFKDIEEKIGKPTAGTVTDPVKYVADLITSLKTTGIIPAEKEKGATITMTGPDGLPVRGEIPGPAVWIPWFINQMKVPITDIVDEVGKRWMAAGLTKPTGAGMGGLPQPQPNTLIRLPEKPKFESPPPPKPEMPQVEQKTPLISIPEPAKPTSIPISPPIVTILPTKENLEKVRMPQLWKMAAELKIGKKGKKAEIIQRILEKQRNEKNEQGKPSI